MVFHGIYINAFNIISKCFFLLAAAEALPDALEGAPADISAEACGMGVVWARCKLLFCRDVSGVYDSFCLILCFIHVFTLVSDHVSLCVNLPWHAG